MDNRLVRALVLMLGLGTAVVASAGKLEKAFEALKVYNYFLARQLFQGQVAKEPAAAWYGLSVIAGRADNPFHQPDSAYTYLVRAEAAFALSDERTRERIKPLGVDTEALAAQRAFLHG
ncbi:MAG: hypothetical protein JNJ64_14345, partial [Flavobacteriales bacterium]|nr:hypothetical protein [Flavobacteriales bacterium]